MEIGRLTPTRRPAEKTPPASPVVSSPPALEPHQPGPVRDLVEKGVGYVTAVTGIPGNLLSGLAIGGYQGGRRGADANFEVKPESVAVGLAVGNALQGLVKGAATGFILLGPAGAAAAAVKDAAQATVSLYLFVKGGSAKAVGTELANAIDSKVGPGEGAAKGAFHGAVAGSTTGVKAGFKTGYAEGRGTTAGVFEGLEEIPKEFSAAKELEGPAWKRVLSAAAGVLSATFAAPAGLALSLLKGNTGEKSVHKAARLGVAAASGALMGGLAGAALGPIGIAVGAGVGALVGLVSPAARKSFDDGLGQSIARARADDGDLGSEVANTRRDMFQKIITGGVSGVRQGWDAGAALLSAAPPPLPA